VRNEIYYISFKVRGLAKRLEARYQPIVAYHIVKLLHLLASFSVTSVLSHASVSL